MSLLGLLICNQEADRTIAKQYQVHGRVTPPDRATSTAEIAVMPSGHPGRGGAQKAPSGAHRRRTNSDYRASNARPG
jgi:hypothetical protein